MIQNKAKEIYSSVGDGAGKEFVANRGWLEKCLKRNDLSLRRRTTMAQKDPDLLTEKLVSFVDFFGKAVSSKGILEKDIIAMDETAVWFDMVAEHRVHHAWEADSRNQAGRQAGRQAGSSSSSSSVNTVASGAGPPPEPRHPPTQQPPLHLYPASSHTAEGLIPGLRYEYFNAVLINEVDKENNSVELGGRFLLQSNDHFNNLPVNLSLSVVQVPTNMYNKADCRPVFFRDGSDGSL
ncbi:hypothetical protein CRUP_012601 [Coryphaenoides rupestris]|nr:hypothetical protein CRUP_012601 [Coryphaenoides rupestris]